DDFIQALGTLKAFSLITVEKGGSTFEIHRLVQLSTQKWLALHGRQEKWQKRVLELIAENFPNGRYKTWGACEILFPHALAALRYGQPSEAMPLQRANLLQKLARYDENQSRYNVTCQRYKEVFQVHEKVQGKEHPDVLTSMDDLVRLLRSRGEGEDASSAILRDLQGLSRLQIFIIQVPTLLATNLSVANK
ncbi:uncharacterized protein K441DRAFT_727330, partial [Cenococcum geophilum 1.58]|uniref:uncharacterized protein n=1 Tax=Cenococcum geophilum 1.58 TaxID=794803 RepID=UPI00358FBC1A